MRAEALMSSPTITCHVNDSLQTAAQRMWDADIGVLPVVNDDGKLTGMLTDRDICMAALTQGRTLDSMLVNSAMGRHVAAARADTEITELADLMASHQVHRIPIVDEAGRPIGIVSMNDLAIESVQPDTPLEHASSTIAHTLAAICRPRMRRTHAA